VGLATIVGLVAIPVLVATVGPGVWGSIAVVQSLATVFGVVVGFGWGAAGPSLVASAPTDARPAILRDATIARGVLYVLCFAAMTAVLLALTRGDVLLSVAGPATYLLAYVASPWYFVGEARPDRLFLLNTLPIAVGTASGLALVAVTRDIGTFLALQASGYLAAIVLELAVVFRGGVAAHRTTDTLRRLGSTLAGQRYAVAASLVSTLYVSLPLVAVQALAVPLVPVYALADRLFKFASVALSPFQQLLQGWVPEAGHAHIPTRSRRAALAGLALGAVGGLFVAILSPVAAPLLSGGDLSIPFPLSIPLGAAFLGIASSAMIGYACLIVLGQVRHVAASTALAAVIGAPLILFAAAQQSLEGVAWAVALSEAVVAAYQALILRRTLARRRGHEGDEVAPD